MSTNRLFSGILTTACALALAAPAVACDTGTKAQKASVNTRANIVEIAASNDEFSTLVAAVKAAGLVDVLQGEGPFTVFAPTNEAFAKLPEGTLEHLLKPENKGLLASILTYHVVAGNVQAKDVVKLKNAKTVQGQNVDIRITKSNRVIVENALVLTTDIQATNGVIHVIDTVILPETAKAGE